MKTKQMNFSSIYSATSFVLWVHTAMALLKRCHSSLTVLQFVAITRYNERAISPYQKQSAAQRTPPPNCDFQV